MPKDWSYWALEDMILVGEIKRAVEPRFYEALPRRDLRLGLAGLCLAAGVMTALLYVWPVLFMTQVIAGGMRGTIFWPVLAGSVVVASLVTWAVTRRDERHWAENWLNVSHWADPPPWK
jgi:hypothetical protein